LQVCHGDQISISIPVACPPEGIPTKYPYPVYIYSPHYHKFFYTYTPTPCVLSSDAYFCCLSQLPIVSVYLVVYCTVLSHCVMNEKSNRRTDPRGFITYRIISTAFLTDFCHKLPVPAIISRYFAVTIQSTYIDFTLVHFCDASCYSSHVTNSDLIRLIMHRVAPTSWGTGGTCPPLLQMAGHGGTVSRRTANKKLTKLY